MAQFREEGRGGVLGISFSRRLANFFLFILIKIKISVQEGLAMNFIEPSFLSAGQNLKKVACLHLMGHHQYPI